MHAIHRPRLPYAISVTATAAVLAIALALALAAGLNNVASGPAQTGSERPAAALQASPATLGWNLSPFAPLLSTPVAAPWPSIQSQPPWRP
jgi:hypothetical protein